MKYYSGIGARATPPDVLKRMHRLAGILCRLGYTLRSGGAEGADVAFEMGCDPDFKEIFKAHGDIPMWTNVFTDLFHPAPSKLKEYPRKLMNRNACQILGRDGSTPVDFVVCWTADGRASGGTGHAIKIAQYFNIPVYNFFYNETDILALKRRIEEI